MRSRQRLRDAYAAALAAVDPAARVAESLNRQPLDGSVHLLAVGKAATAMTRGARAAMGDQVVRGLVVLPAGSPPPQGDLEVITSAHPLPDERSLEAGERVIRFLDQAPDDARFLLLLSGGASSLVESLPAGGSLSGLTALNRRLLADGLPIAAINRVRAAVSAVKGGRLGQRLRGRQARALLVSDVAGNDPRVIGSGLFFPPDRRPVSGEELPATYRDYLPAAPDGPVAGDPALAGLSHAIVASNETAVAGAAAHLRDQGVSTRIAARFVDGDAVAEGERVARRLQRPPTGATVWGAEPTVRLPSRPGRGGRMQTLALAAARRFAGCTDVVLLAAGTDGIDGASEAAGAIVDGGTISRGWQAGWSPDAALRTADSAPYLEATGDRVVTGPSGTNVMDILIGWHGAADD